MAGIELGKDLQIKSSSAPPKGDITKDREQSHEACSLRGNDPRRNSRSWDSADVGKNDIGSPPKSLHTLPVDPAPKSEGLTITGDGEALETERARIERLGRERPAKFQSVGAELAFCYSIIASQFMAVRFLSFAISD